MNHLDFLKSISASSRQKQGDSIPSVKMMYGLSIALHILLILIVMFAQKLTPVPVVPFAVQVDLVSFSPGLPDDSSSPEDSAKRQKSATAEKAEGISRVVVKQPKTGSKVKSNAESETRKESDDNVPIKSLKKKSVKSEPEIKTKTEVAAEPPKVQPKPEPKIEPKPKPEPEPKTKPEPEPKPEPEIAEKAEMQEPVIAKKKESLKKKTYDAEKVEKSEKKSVAEKLTESSQSNTAKNKNSEQVTTEKGETSEQGGIETEVVEKGKKSGNAIGESNEEASQDSGSDGDSQAKANLAKSLSRLKNQVASQSAKKGGGGLGTGAGSGVGGAITSSGGQGSGTTSEAIGLYNLELYYKIRQNWSYNQSFAGVDGKAEVRIVIKILQNGEIRDIWFETHSGNSHLDESALKAVKKSNPLPPLPAGYTSYDIGLIFTPSGLE